MRAAKCGRARARRVMLVLFIGFDWRCFWGASSTFLTSTAAAAPAVAVIEDLLKPEEKTVYAEYTARITQLEITKLMKEYKSHRRAGCEELPPDSDEDNGELSA